MARHTILVTVETFDLLSTVGLVREIQANLEYEAQAMGIRSVNVRPVKLERLLARLDDMAVRPCNMGGEDIEDLCDVREKLATYLGVTYNKETNRYTTNDKPTSR